MKEFNKLTQTAIDEALKSKHNLVDWDFRHNEQSFQLFKAGDRYCHKMGGKDEFTDDMYSFPLGLPKVTPEDCHPFSDQDLAPRWEFRIAPYFYYKTKWGEESLRSGIKCGIYRNDIPFAFTYGYDHNSAYIRAQNRLMDLIGLPVNIISRNWKKEIEGREIWYDNQPSIVKRISHCNSRGYNIYVEPDKNEIKEFKPQGWWTEEEDLNWEYSDGTAAELDDPKINWFRG